MHNATRLWRLDEAVAIRYRNPDSPQSSGNQYRGTDKKRQLTRDGGETSYDSLVLSPGVALSATQSRDPQHGRIGSGERRRRIRRPLSLAYLRRPNGPHWPSVIPRRHAPKSAWDLIPVTDHGCHSTSNHPITSGSCAGMSARFQSARCSGTPACSGCSGLPVAVAVTNRRNRPVFVSNLFSAFRRCSSNVDFETDV